MNYCRQNKDIFSILISDNEMLNIIGSHFYLSVPLIHINKQIDMTFRRYLIGLGKTRSNKFVKIFIQLLI